jgi:hypothetical protein
MTSLHEFFIYWLSAFILMTSQEFLGILYGEAEGFEI